MPVVYGNADPAVLAAALQPYMDRPDTLIIFSADLSHYYPYETAKELDAQTAARIAAGRPEIDYHGYRFKIRQMDGALPRSVRIWHHAEDQETEEEEKEKVTKE